MERYVVRYINKDYPDDTQFMITHADSYKQATQQVADVLKVMDVNVSIVGGLPRSTPLF